MKKLNLELLGRVIDEMVNKEFTYKSFYGNKKETVTITGRPQAIEELCKAIGYSDKSSFYKVLRGEQTPREERMLILQNLFNVSFYLKKEEQVLNHENEKGEKQMILSDVSKTVLLSMFSCTIEFFNKEVDCEEGIEEHIRELDKFYLGIPKDIFEEYTDYLRKLVYNLPEIDCGDITDEDNNIPDEESLHTLIYRHYNRTINAKHEFMKYIHERYALLLQS
ncbi:MAG: hypothetical protein IJ336_00295 [Lachnospiraceae bacterium]|nr:hypothetical protein [Lachnospiraceae bacterium]